MAEDNIIVQVTGGDKKVLDNVSTVKEARDQLGLGSDQRATVNGEAQNDDYGLRGGDFVTFSPPVKGGN